MGFKKGVSINAKEIKYKITDSGCWECISHRPHKEGYFIICRDGKTQRMHRYIYEQNFGKIPAGLVVRHKCDNRACINPEHLEIGTVADNNMDRNLRDRQMRGVNQRLAKLNDEKAKEIFLDDITPRSVLAKKFGVKQSQIWCIKNRITWKHVTKDL